MRSKLPIMYLCRAFAIVSCGVLTATPSMSHEFWVEPLEYQVPSGAPLVADFRNGQKFKGPALAYFERRTARLELVMNGQSTSYAGRMGDIPAIDTTAHQDGLLVIVHQTTPLTLKYAKWEKFQAFADHKDFPDIQIRHRDRGLPESGFSERYTRYVKALVAIGNGAGSDTVSGMETEFVALANPYIDDMAKGFPAQLLYQGEPRTDAQVEVFEKAGDNTVVIRLLRTNAQGKVSVPVKSGHSYFIDAVVLRPLNDDSPEIWESLWAGMSFAIP